MDANTWDERYAASELLWSAGPNATVAELTAGLPAGRALDLGAGEGRNALWLAELGWQVTAVDFSEVATERARRLAARRLGPRSDRLTALAADVLAWEADPASFDLVLLVYLHLPQPQRATVHAKAARLLASGGTLLVLGHDRANLDAGVGGPPDPAVLLTPEEVVADLAGSGLAVQRAEVIRRPVRVEGVDRVALDCLVVGCRRNFSANVS